MSDLGKLTRYGTANPNNPVAPGGWTITFAPEHTGIKVAAVVYHIAVRGPRGSGFEVWIDETFYDNVYRGDVNSWDPSQPMPVKAGDTVFFHYNTAAGAPPKATLFFRQRSPV